MHLKGVWIPFDRALDFANKEKITELLYPLSFHNIGALLYHHTNGTRTSQVMAAAAARMEALRGKNSEVEPYPRSFSFPCQQSTSAPTQMFDQAEPSKMESPRPNITLVTLYPTPHTSASSILGVANQVSFQWCSQGMEAAPTHQQQFIRHSPPPSPQTHPNSFDTHLESSSPKAYSETNAYTSDLTPQVSNEHSNENTGSKVIIKVQSSYLKPIRPHLNLQQDASSTSTPEPSPASETETLSSTTASDYSTSSGEDETLLTRVDQKSHCSSD